MAEGKKDDSAKPDFRTLLDYQDWGRIGAGPYTYGAKHYGDGNFLGLFTPEAKAGVRRMVQATGRHIVKSLRAFPPTPGVNEDEDTGVDHRYHAIAELLMILQWAESPGPVPGDMVEAVRNQIASAKRRQAKLEDECAALNVAIKRKEGELKAAQLELENVRKSRIAEDKLLESTRGQIAEATAELTRTRAAMKDADNALNIALAQRGGPPQWQRKNNVVTVRFVDVGPNITWPLSDGEITEIKSLIRC